MCPGNGLDPDDAHGDPCLDGSVPPKVRHRYFNASIPARAIWASCDDSTPDTPTAPTILPSAMIGKPPSSGTMSFSARKRSPGPPPEMASSSTLDGRLNISAVFALPWEISIEDSCTSL